ncbi:MAG: DUF1570 domain-containing protein [Kiritimatiellia bacterium]
MFIHLSTPIIAVFTYLFCCFSIQSAPSFRADRVYPGMGLKMRVLGNSHPVALPQPKTYIYTLTRGDTVKKQRRFNPFELWYADQHCGTWRDNNGNTMIIGRISKHLPQFALEHVPRGQYEKALNSEINKINPHDELSLIQWVGHFAECRPRKAVKLRTAFNFNLHSAEFVPVNESNPLVYLFRVNIHTPAGRRVPSNWFCAVIDVQDGSSLKKCRKVFESQFLGKVSAAPQTRTSTAADTGSKKLRTSLKGSGDKISDNPAREAARKSIANMKDWWYAETEEYIFLSDLRSSAGKSLVRYMQKNIPHLREAFQTLVPPFDPITETSVVRIFENPDEYKQYVGTELGWSIGLWSSMRRELIILSQGNDHDKTLEIIQHEGFHQYLFHSCNMAHNLPWFNEGHACFFESAEINRRGDVNIPENSRVNFLLRNMDEATRNIPDVLKMDHTSFYNPVREKRALNYTTAWALIYYLHKGAPLMRPNPYRDILPKYLRKLQKSRNPHVATIAAFERIDIERFQERFSDFWKHKRSRGRRYDPLARRHSRF